MSDVKQAAIGRWPGILAALGVDESFLTKKNGPCPFCGGKDRWRFTDHEGRGMWICNHCGKGDGFDLLQKLNGWDFATTAKEVEKIVGTVQAEKPKKIDPGLRITRLREGVVRTHPDVTAYLASRGLKQAPGIAAHPAVGYFDGPNRVGIYPAMVCGIQGPHGDTLSLHITYLLNGRKAPVESPRKMLPPRGSLDGAAIRLYPPAEHMGVAEGIETAISAAILFRLPVWALVNTTLMEKWQAPEGVKRVTIFADKDRNYAGEKAAYALAFRLVNAGLTVDVRLPEQFGDFNDVLLEWLKSGRGSTATTSSAASTGSARRASATSGASRHGVETGIGGRG